MNVTLRKPVRGTALPPRRKKISPHATIATWTKRYFIRLLLMVSLKALSPK